MAKKDLVHTYSTDHLMVEVVKNLVRDFQEIEGLENLASGFVESIKPGGNFRTYQFPGVMQAQPWIHKRVAQLEKLLKRYVFTWECERDLNVEADEKFAKTQERVSTPLNLRFIDRLVVQRARSIVSKILGDYDSEEHMNLCKFSSNATVGSSLHRSYLDTKLAGPLSSSPAHKTWFCDHYLPTDPLLMRIYNSVGFAVEECECLTVTNVPKAWDKLRSITPNTTIGSFLYCWVG